MQNFSELIIRMMKPGEFDPETVTRRILDVQYGTLPEQLLDVYYPEEGTGPWPLLIYIHGGGWTIGNKRESALDFLPILRRGYAVISVDYRLAPGVKFPEFMFDVKTAVRWARANAEQYGFDPERFAAAGDSAGGQLSLMLAFSDRHPECEGEQFGCAGVSSRVQAVVDIYGPTMLEADNSAWVKEAGAPMLPSEADSSRGPLDVMMQAFTSDPDMLPFISPMAYVHPEIPPVLILQGEMDSIVPKQHSILLAERIAALCGPDRAELKLYPDRVHSDRDFLGAETSETVAAFLDRHLK